MIYFHFYCKIFLAEANNFTYEYQLTQCVLSSLRQMQMKRLIEKTYHQIDIKYIFFGIYSGTYKLI